MSYEKLSEIEKLETKSRLAWWNVSTLGEEQYEQELKDTEIALRKLFSSKEDYAKLNLKNREGVLLQFRFKENQIPEELIVAIVTAEVEIESIYTNFRPQIDGKNVSNNELKNILSESTDPILRKKAWEASKEIGEKVEQKVLHLIELRNQAARVAGFTDFYQMRLELQEIDQEKLFELLAQLDELTSPIWKKYKSTLPGVYPWDFSDPFFQEAPKGKIDFDPFYKGKDVVAISQQFYRDQGFDVEDILARSDLFEREKKSQHAFCTCIDRGQDVRILCNLRDNEFWMSVQLHELGHAIYDKYIDQKLPYLLRSPAHTSTTEAIAMFFGRYSKDPSFLKEYCGVSIAPHHDTAAGLLVFARWVLVMTHFERAMYQTKTDLRTLWWDLVEKYQSIKRPPYRHKADWASKLHLACAPVYYQNYILGEMTASQLKAKLPINQFISKLFALGASHPWDKTIELATGEPLSAKYFAADITF